MLRGDSERPDVLAGRQPLQGGDLDLDDKAPAGFQVRGGAAEARDLSLLGGQVLDGIAEQVDDPGGLAHGRGGEVADRDADIIRAWFGL